MLVLGTFYFALTRKKSVERHRAVYSRLNVYPKHMAKTPITVAHGDGIGPEIMAATLHILEAAGAELDIETIEIGEKVYLRGNSSGIEQSSIDSLMRTKVFLKAPITTPQGGGFKSLNVTTRKMLGLYANVRPCAKLRGGVGHHGLNLGGLAHVGPVVRHLDA